MPSKKNKTNIENALQNKDIDIIQNDINELKNSYKVLNDHSTQMTNDIASIKQDIEWLKWAIRIVLFGMIVSISTTIILSIIRK